MNRSNFYKDKVVIVTGSSMGIGKELARQILHFGGKVVISGRNGKRLLAVQNEFHEHGENLLIHTGDVSDFDNNVLLVEKTVDRFGKLDVLINNAGMSAYGNLDKYDYNVVNEIIDTNIKGALFPTKAALPELKKTKGSILFISSIAGFYGLPSYSLYSLSKMSLKALAQSIRIENKAGQIFTGIAYVGFTKNDKNKKVLSAEGIPEKIPERNKWVTSSQTKTAKMIIKQIEQRKNRKIHSALGKLTFFLSKYFPFVLKKMVELSLKKSTET